MTIEEAIKNRERCLRYLEGCAVGTDTEGVEAVRLSLAALREKAEREKNEPLTLDEQKPKEAAATNYEYLRTLEHYEMANAILNIGEDPCQCCPRDKEDRCNEDCNNGLVEWLASPVNPDDPVWTEH